LHVCHATFGNKARSEDRDTPPGLDALQVEAGDDPCLGEAEREPGLFVQRLHRDHPAGQGLVVVAGPAVCLAGR
jgi:hypothetical protein